MIMIRHLSKQKTGKIVRHILCMVLALLLSLPDLTLIVSADDIPYVDINPNTDQTWVAYIDEDNYICIETYDKRRTSNIYYETLGFTVSRCAIGQRALHNGVDSEYIYMSIYGDEADIYETVRLANNQVYIHSIWRYPLTDVISRIRQYGYEEWAQEIEAYYVYHDATDICYIKFDSAMRTVYYGTPSGYIMDFGNSYIVDGTVYMNRPSDNNVNPRAIMRAYGWADPSRLPYHYNLYLTNSGSIPDFDYEDVPVPMPISLYETRNFSSEYDISMAIPSGEQVTNVISASSFIGNELPVVTETQSSGRIYQRDYNVYHTWTETIQHPGEWRHVVNMYPGETLYNMVATGEYRAYVNGVWVQNVRALDRSILVDVRKYFSGSTEDITHKELISNGTLYFTAQVRYQRLTGTPQIFAFDNMSVTNSAFPNSGDAIPTLHYTAGDGHTYVPSVSVTINAYIEEAISLGQHYMHIEGGNSQTADYDWDGNKYHYYFPASSVLPSDTAEITVDTGTDPTYNSADVERQIDSLRQSSARTIANSCYSRNDLVLINDETHAFSLMSDDLVYGAYIYCNGWTSPHSYGRVAAETDNSYTSGSMNAINTQFSAARATGQQTVPIPIVTENNDWPTGAKVQYVNVFDPASMLTMAAGKNIYGTEADSIYEHVMEGGILPGHNGGDPADGYPIRVHTPVISPITIVDGEGNTAIEKTQLITGYSYNTAAENQLLLDNTYYVRWDNDLWQSAIYGDVGYGDVFDRYVDSKWVRFPFTVEYRDTLYEKGSNGYTQWINIDMDDWELTPFYIPSFAEEGGAPGNNIYIECKVQAWNVGGRYEGAHSDAVQSTLNNDRTNYVATARRCVQLSGYIYDFTVTGTTNKLMYTGEGVLEHGVVGQNTGYAFCPTKEEKKSGTRNRLGGSSIRFLTDGTITQTFSDLQTVPLRNGQSLAFNGMGNIFKGQKFSFEVKTIANLDGINDSIQIIPTFTYITSTGEVLYSENGDFKMYIPSSGKILEYNSADTDTSSGSLVSLNDPLFAESYYDASDSSSYQFGDWVSTSVANENVDKQNLGWLNTLTNTEYLARQVPSYTFNHISIPAELRFISGEYEQLARNMDNQYIRGGESTLLEYDMAGYDEAAQQRFIYSMQQWQSMYAVPSTLKIVDTRGLGGTSFDIYSYIENADMFSWEDDPIVDDGRGYLIINFNIIAYKDGVPYLQYNGGNSNGLNMWEREGFKEDPDIPTRYGDVAIVDMSRSMNDYFEPAIMNIN